MLAKIKTTDKTTLFLIFAIFLIQFIGLFFSSRYLPVNGDEALLMIIAQDVANGHFPLLFHSQPYQFPIEGYLFSPFASILEPSIAAARTPGWLLRQVGIALLIITIISNWQGYKRYSLLLLIMFPVAIVYLLTSLYGIPQYSYFFFSFCLLAFLMNKIINHNAQEKIGIYILFAAFIAGLALSSYRLAIMYVFPFVVTMSVYLLLHKRWMLLAGAAVSFSVGLIPAIIARILYPSDVIASVTETKPLSQGISTIFDLTIPEVIPRVLGANAPVFESWSVETISSPTWLINLCIVIYFVLLALLLLRLIVSIFKKQQLQFSDWFSIYLLIIVAFSIFAFSMSSKAAPYVSRYLLVLGWTIPFIVVLATSWASQLKKICVVMTVVVVVFNIRNILAVTDEWRDADFPHRADTPYLGEEINKMYELGAKSCFAPYLYAHRVTYLTNREILCVQPYNERFPGWPYPHREEVILDPTTVYFMNNTYRTSYTAHLFSRHLKGNNVEYSVIPVENERIKIFTNFKDKSGRADYNSNVPIVFYEPGMQQASVSAGEKMVRVVFNSIVDLPEKLKVICQNEEQTYPFKTENYYFDGYKPLMFVDNQLLQIPGKCEAAQIQFIQE